LGRPTHPLFVHFPAGLLWDLAGQFRPEEDFGRAARLSIGLGQAGAVPAAVTGLVGGSRRKRFATYHLAAQLTSGGLRFKLSASAPGAWQVPDAPRAAGPDGGQLYRRPARLPARHAGKYSALARADGRASTPTKSGK